ncbi:hypothetical protein CDL15_Pgr010575 [Punica granatum]|uniref:Uncharacterized protein n=1 Tax=Punica granatum TaxID=22663 RepID=A0A218WXA4_PUNGR|nr:hypothetical protein CDL15_Pgr010575 [Punica granatum]
MGDERGGRAVVELKLNESVWSECGARAVVKLKLDESVWSNQSSTSPSSLISSCFGAREVVELWPVRWSNGADHSSDGRRHRVRLV